MDKILQNAIHVASVLMMPPLLVGLITKVKALFAGRVGPPLLQPYYDLVKLFQKGSVFSTTTTWVFRAGPVVGVAATVLAALIVPLTDSIAPISFELIRASLAIAPTRSAGRIPSLRPTPM